MNYPTLLGHVEPQLLGFSPETVVAEKLEAIVSLGVRTSRMKDYFDLCWLAENRTFDGQILHDAVATTFARRNTPTTIEVPEGLSDLVTGSEDKKRQWNAFGRRMGFDEPPKNLEDTLTVIRRFVMPVLVAIAKREDFGGTWAPGAGWRG